MIGSACCSRRFSSFELYFYQDHRRAALDTEVGLSCVEIQVAQAQSVLDQLTCESALTRYRAFVLFQGSSAPPQN